MRKILRWLGLGLLVLVVGIVCFGVAVRFFDGPVGPFPGGPLVAGQLVEEPVRDWTFVDAVPKRTDQKGAISTFEGLGFRPEALMVDHVKDLDGETHDLVVMSHPVAEFEQTLAAYGVAENLS